MNQEKVLQDKQTKDTRLTRINYFGKQTNKKKRLTRYKPRFTRNKPQGTQQNKSTGKHRGKGWKTTFWQQEPGRPGLKC